MDDLPICPYKSIFEKKCVHKGVGQKRTKKNRCGYTNPEKCMAYMEWLLKYKKNDSRRLKTPKNTTGEQE